MGKISAIRSSIVRFCYRFFPAKAVIGFFYLCKMKKRMHWKNPRRFTEKLQMTKIDSQYLGYSQYCDKIEVKKYVNNALGEDVCFPTIAQYKTMTLGHFDSLPRAFVIKSNHNSQDIDLIYDKNLLSQEDKRALVNKHNAKIRENMYARTHETQYKNIDPYTMIEPLFLDESGHPPADYKFYCFNHHVEFLVVDEDRFGNHKRSAFNRAFNKQDWTVGPHPLIDYDVNKPANFDEMIHFAEILSEPFSFVRVDLYSIRGKTFFGELTFTPASGFEAFSKDELDFYYGSLFLRY